jgi:hypothetical protein
MYSSFLEPAPFQPYVYFYLVKSSVKKEIYRDKAPILK